MNINTLPVTYSYPPQKPVKFSGHLGSEKYLQNGLDVLIHETAFFRDEQTKEFVKNYILRHFKNKNKIKMIVGGCSTGEECITYSMLLNSIKNKITILGIDLSADSIKQARSRNYLFEVPNSNDLENIIFLNDFYSAYKDSYLVSPTPKRLTPMQLKYKKLFEKFFKKSISLPKKEKISLRHRIRNWILRQIFSKNYFKETVEKKHYTLKPQKANNCTFEQGDIMDIEQITGKKKADVITFTNSLYHLITNEIDGIIRFPREDMEEVCTNLFQRIKNSLNKDGILVLGEEEKVQCVDKNGTIVKVLEQLGFQPLNKTKSKDANIWQVTNI